MTTDSGTPRLEPRVQVQVRFDPGPDVGVAVPLLDMPAGDTDCSAGARSARRCAG
jgi:hypothetical protein